MIRTSSPLFVLILLTAVIAVIAYSGDNLVRNRREWILPPKPLIEHEDYTDKEFIAKIRSDVATSKKIEYSLTGIGADQKPFHVFVVDPETGFIKVTQKLDREIIDTYNLSGVARFVNGEEAEKKIDIRIKVVDINDNAPVFGKIEPGKVKELSPQGTSVMKITATDADEPGNKNSQMAYSILEQNPSTGMFSIDRDGTIRVNKPNLDRESVDQYTLKVKAQDLNGEPGGKSDTSTVTINIEDVNDNKPSLEQSEGEGNIDENTENVEVMRFKAVDLDLEGSENWDSEFEIVSGNEMEYFSIIKDHKTNEGILMLNKKVDYENTKHLDLGISVKNKAAYHFGGSGGDSANVGFGGGGGGGMTGANLGSGSYDIKTVRINVKNQLEGASFLPKVKAIPISEGGSSFNVNDVIGSYQATDIDTGKPADNVRYVKGSDPDNWLTIDPKTAEIKLNKIPDRESPFLVNGTYIAQVLSITDDMPAQTATGTIAIQVQDFNDNCPKLTSSLRTICAPSNAAIVNARDDDASPNGAPFDFIIIPEETQGKWNVEHFNETAALLRAEGTLWPGSYEVTLLVKDQQGVACPDKQKAKIQVCTCEDGLVCGKRGAGGQPNRAVEFGPAGIGLLFLGLLLLLLPLLLLFFCKCGGLAGAAGDFVKMPFDTKSHLINYHTEGQGENTAVPLLNMPTQVDMGMVNNNLALAPMPSFVTSMDGMNGGTYRDRYPSGHGEGTWGMTSQTIGSGLYSEFGARESRVTGGMNDGMALPDHILGQYYSQKVTSENENLGVKDGFLVYDYEGQGSPAGSVGCCSLLESDNDLHFLDDLGTKFKTLAEVCGGKKIPMEVKQVFTPPPSASINTMTSVSSLMTAQQLPPLPKLQPTVPQTVVRETSESSQVMKESTATMREGMTTVRNGVTMVNEGMANQGQMLLLQPQQQQPIYYTTGPMLQPTHFVVQPQVQNTVLLAEAPATNLQGMVLVNGSQTGPAQGVVVQGQTLMSGGQAQGPNMVLVESSGIHGGGANLIHTGNFSGSQTMMMVEGNVPAGSMSYVQGGTLQPGGLSGSQRVLVVGGSTSSGGHLVQEAGGLSKKGGSSGSQRVLYSKGNTTAGSKSTVVSSSSTTVSSTPTYQKVVVQETREKH